MTVRPTPLPLRELEARVQSRAKGIDLDLAGEGTEETLRRLIADEVDQWNIDFRAGRRHDQLADPSGAADRALRNLAGFGPLGPLMGDPDVWEIMVNAPDAIFVKRHRGPSGYHDEVFHDDEHVSRTITKILDQAGSSSHRKLDPAEGLQDAQLEDGSRVHIVHGDLTRGGHLVVNIRKFTGVAFRRLDELVESGTLEHPLAELLAEATRSGASILFSGAPGSGKTTLLSCCAAELDPSRRVVVAEEVFEADIPVANVASLQTRPARPDRAAIDLRRLVAGFLRMAPDVAIVGEVRDREALPLLLTLSSGVQGFTTIHAGNARQALTRLRFVCQLSEAVAQLPLPALSALVAESIDLVVHSGRDALGPRVQQVVAVEDLAVGAESSAFTTTEVCHRRDGRIRWTGQVSPRLASLSARLADVSAGDR